MVNTVKCAMEIQTALKIENGNLSRERRMRFRIGVNLGDVMVEGEQIYGDGVNVAARLESLAELGGICVSATVKEHIKKQAEFALRRPRPATCKKFNRTGTSLSCSDETPGYTRL